MPMHDYKCDTCDKVFEECVPLDPVTGKCPPVLPCKYCTGVARIIYLSAPKIFGTIVPDYPGAKKQKAGYVHTHGDRPATKVQGKGWSPD
jgi:hypothetical protein